MVRIFSRSISEGPNIVFLETWYGFCIPLYIVCTQSHLAPLPVDFQKFCESNCSGIEERWAQAVLPAFLRDSWETQEWVVLVSWEGGKNWKELEANKGPSGYSTVGISLLVERLPLCHQNHADPEGLSRCSMAWRRWKEGWREGFPGPTVSRLPGFRDGNQYREVKSRLWRAIKGCHVSALLR